MATNPLDTQDQRLDICKELGFASLGKVHEIVTQAVKRGPGLLMQKGLHAKNLIKLGYDAPGLCKLGFQSAALEKLGFATSTVPAASAKPQNSSPVPPTMTASADATLQQHIQQLIASGNRAIELRRQGITVQHCRRIGLSASDLRDLGYTLAELSPLCTAAELVRAQFNIRELRNFYDGNELRRAGCSASDMRLAGFGVRELLNFGYGENHVRTAGYSTIDLAREGLTRTTHLPGQSG